jgi:NAD(P)H-dependent FMN reductase
METTIKIKIIIGSTRSSRFSEKPAHWIYEEARNRKDVSVELLDLRDYPMPFLEPKAPTFSSRKHMNNIIQMWATKIKDGDAFIIITPEYNHGYPAVLKNALDSISEEWNKKPVGFVSYGNAGGVRSVEQLRQVVIELKMVPIGNAVHISGDVYKAVVNEKVPVNPEVFNPLRDHVQTFLNEFISTARVLKTTREA